MIELLQHPDSFPFAVALALVASLLIIELVTLLFGQTLSAMVDNLLPDFELGDVDLDADVDGEAAIDCSPSSSFSPVSSFLTWLRFDQLPALVILIVLTTVYGLVGLLIQSLTLKYYGAPIDALVASVFALLAALPISKPALEGLARVLPRDETEAVSSASFVGQRAKLVQGTARFGLPAQARLRDAYGQAHYVMVEPEDEGSELPAGSTVLLLARDGARFRAKLVTPKK